MLRYDPLFKLLAGRSPEGRELASQPTLSRFENAISVRSLRRLEDVFIDQFIASFATPPRHLTFDIDVFDDPTHGQQQLTFFHGYYDQYQYLPRVITCKENDLVAMVCLLFGTAHGRRPALHLADAADQGRRGDRGSCPADRGPACRFLALPGSLPAGRTGRSRLVAAAGS